MRKRLRSLPPRLLVLNLIYPGIRWLLLAMDLELELYFPQVYMVVSFAIMLSGTVMLCVWKLPKTRSRNVLYILTVLATLVNAYYWVVGRNDPLIVILCWLDFVCAVILLLVRGGKGKILVCLLLVPYITIATFFVTLFSMHGGISSGTVIRELDSPQGRYTAQVVDWSEGALGGDTLVDVQDHRVDVDLLIGKLTSRKKRVYKGEWGEYASMVIHWADEETLVINGVQFPIR